MIAGNAPLTLGSVKFIVGEALKDESKRDAGRMVRQSDPPTASAATKTCPSAAMKTTERSNCSRGISGKRDAAS